MRCVHCTVIVVGQQSNEKVRQNRWSNDKCTKETPEITRWYVGVLLDRKKQRVRDDEPRLSWAVAGLRLLAGLPSGGGKWARTAYCPQQLVPRLKITIAGPGPY